MSALLTRWVNESLHLSKRVEYLERDFANGFMYAEVLAKLGYIEGVGDYRERHSTSACLRNFKRLGLVLTEKLDIRLDSSQVDAIINEEPGAATKLLLNIMTTWEEQQKPKVFVPPRKSAAAVAASACQAPRTLTSPPQFAAQLLLTRTGPRKSGSAPHFKSRC